MFPTLVYRIPGIHQREGGTYSILGVTNQDAFDAALTDGWFETLPEAIESLNPKVEQVEPPPTREELELKAMELEIKFDGRTSDRKLRDLIAATLEE